MIGRAGTVLLAMAAFALSACETTTDEAEAATSRVYALGPAVEDEAASAGEASLVCRRRHTIGTRIHGHLCMSGDDWARGENGEGDGSDSRFNRDEMIRGPSGRGITEAGQKFP